MYKALLKEFREDRRINGKIGIKNNVGEEALEVAEAILSGDELKVIGEICDIVVFCENYLSCFDSSLAHCGDRRESSFDDVIIEGLLFKNLRTTWDEVIAIKALSLIVVCKSAIESAGYDFRTCMIEVCHKILSRNGAYCEKRKKWCKDKSQPKSELYAPDYASCKKKS